MALLAAVAIGAGSGLAQGVTRPGAPQAPMPREVVMLVGHAIEDLEDSRPDPARALLQMPLNHLGLRLSRVGVDGDAPPDLDPAVVCAFGTWFENQQQLPDWVWPWLERQPPTLRILHFGSLQPLASGDDGQRLRAWLQRRGLGYDATQMADPARVVVEYGRGEHVPYESRPVYELLHHGPWNLDGRNSVWLATRDRQQPRRERAPVVTGAFGGIALQPWFVRAGGAADDRRFYVDPFAFLGEALGLAGVPAPDPSVRYGRRLFVLHVDGDGFESPSAVVEGRLNGEVFRDRIIDRWQVPMTISFIVAGLCDRLDPGEPTPRMQIARDILARPWVEAASHSVLHPLDWRRQLTPRSLPRSVVWYPGLEGYRHDMVAEVRESIAFVDRWLVPAGKRCRVMLWSGNANPTEAALAAVAEAGCWNLNGGLFRWDELHASVGFVSPWGHAVGAQFQVFAGAPNENVFDGFYTTMPGAFRHVDRTLENTGRGRILKPANVYVHFYSAEHPARLRALEGLLERWLDREPVLVVPASAYAAAVDDCQRRCAITRTAEGWSFAGFGHCRTVRFDAEPRAIDWANSRGLAGAQRSGERLFVHLAAERAELRFVPAGAPRAAEWPHVEQADADLGDVVLAADAVQFVVPAGRARRVVVAGLPAASSVDVGLGRIQPTPERLVSDARGRACLELPAGPEVFVRITVGRTE